MLKHLFKEKPFWILIVAELLFFYRPIFLGEVFFFRDLHSHFLPKRELIVESIAKWELPLWDPYLQGGKPLLGNPNNMALYPSNLLYLVMTPHRALTMEIIFHHLLGLLAIYIFCRLLSFRKSSSFVAAAIYGFAGYSLSATNLLNWLIAIAYLPLLFCFWHLHLQRGKWHWWVCAVLAASLQFLAGAPEFTLFTFLTLFGWSFCYGYPPGWRKILISSAALAVCTVALCAIQIFPALELTRATIRAVGFGFDSSTIWSLHPYRILEFFFPGIIGSFESVHGYWGQKLSGDVPLMLSVYLGMASIVFAAAGVFSKHSDTKTFPKLRLFLFGFMILSFLLALGGYLPGSRFLFETFSIRLPFRFPIKFLSATIFPLAILAAVGFENLFLERQKRAVFTFWFIDLVLLMLVILSLGFFFEPVSRAILSKAAGPLIREALTKSALHSFIIWTLICVVFTYRKRIPRAQWALAAIVVIDLFLAGKSTNFYGAPNLYTDTPELAKVIQHKIGNGKLYTSITPASWSKTQQDDLYTRYRIQQQLLGTYLAANYRIPVIFHDDLDGSSLLELNFMRLVMSPLEWERKLPVLSAAGVRAILTDGAVNKIPISEQVSIHNPYGAPLRLYINENAMRPAEFISRSKVTRSFRETLDAMTETGYNPRALVILENGGSTQNRECKTFSLKEQFHGPEERIYNIETECAGYLVFQDPHYPGWRVFVNQAEVSLLKANGIHFAIFLQPGKHHVREVYSPRSVIYGAAISILTLAFLSIFTMKRNRR